MTSDIPTASPPENARHGHDFQLEMDGTEHQQGHPEIIQDGIEKVGNR
jgi:hypothetical protein